MLYIFAGQVCECAGNAGTFTDNAEFINTIDLPIKNIIVGGIVNTYSATYEVKDLRCNEPSNTNNTMLFNFVTFKLLK